VSSSEPNLSREIDSRETSMHLRRMFRIALVLGGILTVAGCGSENPLGRKAVSGNVTLDGGALDQVNIEFHPTFEGGVQSGGRIVSGSYSIPAREGVTLGKYRVSISDFVPTPPLPPGHMPGDPLSPSPKPKVPPEWNSKSQRTVEVKKDGPFKFDFDILTKKSDPRIERRLGRQFGSLLFTYLFAAG
jgi:hypothetical protein